MVETDHKAAESQLTEADFGQILDEVIDVLDGILLDNLNNVTDDPSLIYTATVLGEYGIEYFGTGNGYAYALMPDEMHPGPWTWYLQGRDCWKAYDSNNICVVGNVSTKVKKDMSTYIWEQGA